MIACRIQMPILIAMRDCKSPPLAALFDVTLVFCFEKKGVLRDENDDDSVILSDHSCRIQTICSGRCYSRRYDTQAGEFF